MIHWPNLKLKPINLWNIAYMESKRVVELAYILEMTSDICSQECRIDVWKERCTTCKKPLEQIEKEKYESNKTS